MTQQKNYKISFLKLLVSLCFVTICSNVLAQSGFEWARTYNANMNPVSNDGASKIGFDIAGNIYTAGTSDGDILILKYSPAGTLLWSRLYNGPANMMDEVSRMYVDGFGNCIIAGITIAGNDNENFLTLKYDSNGNLLWSKIYDGPGHNYDYITALACDASGNVYVGGPSNRLSLPNWDWDWTIIKYSPAGNVLWTKIEDMGLYGMINQMVIDNSGNLIAAGNWSNGGLPLAVKKYDPSGNQIGLAYITAPGKPYNEVTAMLIDHSGNLVLTARSWDLQDAYDVFTFKFNSNLGFMWQDLYNSPANGWDASMDIKVDASDNIYVCGSVSVNSVRDILELKYNSSGARQWALIYNGIANEDDIASSLIVDPSGVSYVAGGSNTSHWNEDICVLKVNSSGSIVQVYLYDGNAHSSDYAPSIGKDFQGNIFVAAVVTQQSTLGDAALLKLSQMTGVSGINGEVPDKYSLSQNYPNPFNPSTKISFALPKTSKVKVTVFDITGKVVDVLLNEVLNAGNYEYTWNGSNLSSGTYFCRMETEGFSDVKKMMLVK